MTWLAKRFRGYVLNRAVSMIATRLRQDKALIYALQEYRAGSPFFRIVKSYATNSEVKADDKFLAGMDEIEAELRRRPFKELLGRYLAGVKLPDFDGDPENDIALTDALERVIEETLR